MQHQSNWNFFKHDLNSLSSKNITIIRSTIVELNSAIVCNCDYTSWLTHVKARAYVRLDHKEILVRGCASDENLDALIRLWTPVRVIPHLHNRWIELNDTMKHVGYFTIFRMQPTKRFNFDSAKRFSEFITELENEIYFIKRQTISSIQS